MYNCEQKCLQSEHKNMGESLHDHSWIQDFEADFQLKMLNKASMIFSGYINAIDHFNMI